MLNDKRNTIVLCHNTAKYLYLHYNSLIDRLCSLGYQVACICPIDEFVEKLERPGVVHIDWTLSQHGMNPFAELRSIWSLRKILEQISAKMVITFSIKPNLYAALIRPNKNVVRQYCMVTGLGYVFLEKGLLHRLLRKFVTTCYRQLFSRNIHAIFQNTTDCQLFTEHGFIRHENTSVIPGTGVDSEYYLNSKNYDITNFVRFIFVGRLLADKGLRELLHAARALDRSVCSVTIVGPYDNNPGSISREVFDRSIREGVIQYVGEVDDVRGKLKDADIFVLPSYREGLSRSIMEAMSSGLGIITTDVPGCRELVEDESNGFVVPAMDAHALQSAMQKIIDAPELIKVFGMNSRNQILETYEIGKVNDKILRILGLVSC